MLLIHLILEGSGSVLRMNSRRELAMGHREEVSIPIGMAVSPITQEAMNIMLSLEQMMDYGTIFLMTFKDHLL